MMVITAEDAVSELKLAKQTIKRNSSELEGNNLPTQRTPKVYESTTFDLLTKFEGQNSGKRKEIFLTCAADSNVSRQSEEGFVTAKKIPNIDNRITEND